MVPPTYDTLINTPKGSSLKASDVLAVAATLGEQLVDRGHIRERADFGDREGPEDDGGAHPFFAGLTEARIIALRTGHWPMASEPKALDELGRGPLAPGIVG